MKEQTQKKKKKKKHLDSNQEASRVSITYTKELLQITPGCDLSQNGKSPIDLVSQREGDVHDHIFRDAHLRNVRRRPRSQKR